MYDPFNRKKPNKKLWFPDTVPEPPLINEIPDWNDDPFSDDAANDNQDGYLGNGPFDGGDSGDGGGE